MWQRDDQTGIQAQCAAVGLVEVEVEVEEQSFLNLSQAVKLQTPRVLASASAVGGIKPESLLHHQVTSFSVSEDFSLQFDSFQVTSG
jgi:hypothetical protein